MNPNGVTPSVERRVFVTGGARGIGEAIVRRCVAGGATVIFCYRDQVEAAENLVVELQETGAQVSAVRLDVLDREKVFGVFRDLAADGPLFGLVNNVGHMGHSKFRDIEIADWDLMLSGNLTGAFNCVQAALSLLTLSPGAAIVNITSRLGQVGVPGFVHLRDRKSWACGLH